MVERRLEGVEVFGVTEEDEFGEGVDGDGGVSETVKKEDGLLSEVDVIVTSWRVAWAKLIVLTTLSQWD